MSDINDMKQYLLSLNIPSKDKRYTMNFCKKMEYLDNLKQITIKELHEPVISGYGNVNSQICIITKNEKALNVIKPLLQNVLDKFHINMWDIYLTYVDKTTTEYNRKFSYLAHELSAIGAKIIYYIDNDENNYNALLNAFQTDNIKLSADIHYINVTKLGSSDIEDRKELWESFKHMINFREIIKE